MAKILGKTHKPKVLGADTHSVSLRELGAVTPMTCVDFHSPMTCSPLVLIFKKTSNYFTINTVLCFLELKHDFSVYFWPKDCIL